MPFVTDPWNGLQFYELSHMWGCGVPSYPGDDDVISTMVSNTHSLVSKLIKSEPISTLVHT